MVLCSWFLNDYSKFFPSATVLCSVLASNSTLSDECYQMNIIRCTRRTHMCVLIVQNICIYNRPNVKRINAVSAKYKV